MNEQHDAQTPQIYCFRCTNDCIHVVCFNVTISLKQPDFLKLVEALNSLQVEMEEESPEGANVNPTRSDSLVM